MSIFVHKNSRIICQGITGKQGSFHTRQCREYGSNFVGGVTPGKAGQIFDGLPIFDSVLDAKNATDCDVSMIFVPAPYAADAILEAIDAKIQLIICITEGIPIHDMLEVSKIARRSTTSRLIGPNCPGVISVDACKVGIMPGYIHKKGPLGVVSRSGTLTYEAVWQLTQNNVGQSTCVGIGGDPLNGTNFIDVLELMEKDPETKAILLIGEIGGTQEEEAADWIQKYSSKPTFAFIAGKSAPPGKRMGHAGAIISQGKGNANDKIAALRKANVHVIENPALIGTFVKEQLLTQGFSFS